MATDELRQLMPVRIVRGALLRTDGTAVGLVGGGASEWELLSRTAQAERAIAYHQLLLALEQSIHIYTIDQPLNLSHELTYLLDRQSAVGHITQAAILGELADRLAESAQNGSIRTKQTIWALSVAPPVSSTIPLWSKRRNNVPATAKPGTDVLRLAQDRARRLADALAGLGGYPPPRLLEPEEIAHLLYLTADPIRAIRYPLVDTLLDRVHRVVSATADLHRES